MFTKVPAADEGLLFYTHEFEPAAEVEEVSDTDTESFDDYLWMGMEDEEEFEKTEMQRLEEEALMEECVEAMLEEESMLLTDLRLAVAATEQLQQQLQAVVAGKDTSVSQSTLNPLAIEFIPANWLGAAERTCDPAWVWTKRIVVVV